MDSRMDLKMVNCSVPLCTSHKNKKVDGVSFHEYPSDETLRVKWLKAVSRQEENSVKPWQPSDKSTVCSNHFLPTDFKAGLKKKILIAGAVPSVFDGYPSYKQMQQKPGRREIVKVKEQATYANIRKRKRAASPAQSCPSTTLDNHPQLKKGDVESYNEVQSAVAVDNRPESVMSTTHNAPSQRTSHANSVQTVLTSEKLDIRRNKYMTLQQRYRRLSKKMAELEDEVERVRDENKCLKDRHLKYNIDALEEDCGNGYNKAEFLREQLLLYKQTKPHWTNKTIKYCVLWHSKSPTSYCLIRGEGVLSLPSRSTLKRYKAELLYQSKLPSNI